MYVNQINAYELKSDCDNNTALNEILDFEAYDYKVKKSITMSNATTIPQGNNISLRASDFIELKAGFEVPLGAELYLDINPCDGSSSSLPVIMENRRE
jgi:hypothetical protein